MFYLIGILRTAADPSGAIAPPPLSGEVELGSPMGELSSVSETEGVWFVEWQQLKNTNGTPFAASRHFPQRGQRGGCAHLRMLLVSQPLRVRMAVAPVWVRA